MGLVACQAAYRSCGDWVDRLVAYLGGNLNLMRETFRARMPRVELVEPEGTYLPWVNFSKLNLSASELDRFIIDRAKLWLDSGPIFGAGGAGFQRFNVAVPRVTLKQALAQLENALK
jgi:cystathionine beta-lyase